MNYDFEYEYEVIADKTDLDELKIRLAHLYTEIALISRENKDIEYILEYIDQTILRLNILVHKSDILYLEDFVDSLSTQKGSDYSGLKPFVNELKMHKRSLYKAERSLKNDT